MVTRGVQSENPGGGPPATGASTSRDRLLPPTTNSFQSFLATSGPVIRLRSGNVEAMIATDATSPPVTVAQYAIPGIRNAMSTWEWRYKAADTSPTTIETAATRRRGNALSS